MKRIVLTLIAFCFFSLVYSQNDSLTIVKPGNTTLYYEGKIDFEGTLGPTFCYPGTSVSMRFKGSAVYLFIHDSSQKNYYEVIIDGKVEKTILGGLKKTYKLNNEPLSKGEHMVTVFKRTECFNGTASFKGFGIKDGDPLKFGKPAERKIEVIGNSITCGYGNEASIDTQNGGNPSTGFHAENENNYIAWGAITARNLNSQYMCSAYSGKGMYRNADGDENNTIPKIYDRIFPDDANSPKWDMSNYIPDVVVINLGTNDFAKEAQNDPVDSAKYVSTYIEFVSKLKETYKETKVICAIGSMMSDGWPPNKFVLTKIRRYVNAVVDALNKKYPGQIFFFEFDTQSPPYGEDWHPDRTTQQEMADKITAFIKEKMGW